MAIENKLERAGAQFLVLGELLVRGIETHKTYLNAAGHDLVACNGEDHRSCRLQVISPTSTEADDGINPHSDFVVVVLLSGTGGSTDYGERQFFVIPTSVALRAESSVGGPPHLFLDRIQDGAKFRDAWHLIGEFLWVDRTRPEALEMPTLEALGFGTSA